MPELVTLIQELVRIDSVNPALDPTHSGETEIARFVERWARSQGLETEWLEPVPGRPSVIVTARGSGEGRSLLLNAHLDTVGVEGMDAPFEPSIRDGLMYGRGVADMKASLAGCLLAVANAAKRGTAGDVILTAVADEEHASIGTEAVMAAVTASAAVVTEPTDLELHVAHRGFSVIEIEFQGKASHTSRPFEGINALTHLGRFLPLIERGELRLREGHPHELLGYGSLQAVTAQGGKELFTTPAGATVVVERRTLPGEGAVQCLAEMESLLDELAAQDSLVRAQCRPLVEREPFETPPGSEIEQHLSGAIKRTTGRQPQRLGAPYWTDAALVSATGIPTILFGPRGGKFHGDGEWLDVASAHQFLEVLDNVIESYCGAVTPVEETSVQ